MSKVNLLPYHFVGSILLYCYLTMIDVAQAQTNLKVSSELNVTSDGTLSTKVHPDGNNFIITEGTKVGANLFHSFEQFSIPDSGSAIFSNQLNIQNIFSRVTGNYISQIEGLIKTNGTANLFLINPNGIIFGKNAQLDVGGSFIATTANQIDFAGANGVSFVANRDSTPLLTANIPIGLNFRENSGKIINRSTANNSFGLEISSGKTLALIGSKVVFEGGNITSIGGRIEVGSVVSPAYVSLLPISQGWMLNYDGVQEFDEIMLSGGAVIGTALLDEGSGDVFLHGKNILITEMSEISSQNFSENIGGTITIKATQSIQLSEDSDIITATDFGSMGTGGSIVIETKQLLVKDQDSLIQAVNQGLGRGGDIIIKADDLIEVDGGQDSNSISTETVFFNEGISGDIVIETNQLILKNGGFLSGTTDESGSGGRININAKFINISGKGKASDGTIRFSGIFSRTIGENSIGNAGSININTQRLQITNEGVISVASAEGSQGQAGNITINSNSLTLNRGTITAETAKSGREEGANITLEISDSLTLENESLISATANGDANGGNININTPLLTVFPPTGLNGSDIIARAVRGRGGQITINSQGIFGIAERPAIPGNQTNDIDASSEFGASGQVEINSTIDPNRGVIQLPETVVDPNALVAQNACKRGSESEFVITGRGGLPPSLNENLNSEATQVDLIEPAPIVVEEQVLPSEQTNMSNTPVLTPNPEQKSNSPPSEATPIVPAQGWIFNEKGEVVLVAYDPTVTGSQRLKEKPAGCPAP